MANLKQLYKLRIFSLEDVICVLQLGRSAAAASLLRWQMQGIIKMIRRNMYTVIDPATDAPLISKYELASHLSPTSYVAWHTALEFHGLAHQPFYNAQVASESRFNNFTFADTDYEYYHSPLSPSEENGIISPIGNPYVKVTDLERTIVDCCDKIDRAGGIEEFLHCMEGITILDELKLKKYLDFYNKGFLYQKIGFILEYTQDRNNISKDFIEFCRTKGAKNTKRLTNGSDSDNFVKKWFLYVPHECLTTKEEFNELI